MQTKLSGANVICFYIFEGTFILIRVVGSMLFLTLKLLGFVPQCVLTFLFFIIIYHFYGSPVIDPFYILFVSPRSSVLR